MSTIPAGSSGDLRPLAEWYLDKNHRRLWFFPLTLGLVALIAVMILRGSMEDPEENYAQSRAAVAALAQPPVPPEENAWEDYKKTLAVRVMYTGSDDSNPFYKTDDDSKYFKPGDIQELWKANTEAIEWLHACGAKERCDMGIDQLAKPFDCPSLMNARECANLLAMDARCHAIAGNHVAAAKSLHAIRGLARHLETQPLLIMEMIATAINGIADDCFGAILIFDPPEKLDDLQAYKLALEQNRDPFERAARSITYENTIGIYYFDSCALGKMPKPAFPRGMVDPGMSALWYGSDRRCAKLVAESAAAALRRRQQPENTSSAINRFQTGPAILTSIIIPSYGRAMKAYFEVEERSRLAVVAAAFLQYRVKYGRDPLSMEQLVPEFLSEVPKGLFHDKPIRFTREKARHLHSSTMMDIFYNEKKVPSVRIYTVGRNDVDDGGNNNGLYSNQTDTDDTIFHVPLATEKSEK